VTPDEHIRYKAFVARLAAQPQPDDAFVSAFMSEVTSDPDPVMGQAASVALIDHSGVTDSLLKNIEEWVPSGWKAASTRLSERRLQLKITEAPNEAALWGEAVASGSRRVHLWLLDQPSLPTDALVMLPARVRHGLCGTEPRRRRRGGLARIRRSARALGYDA
jgi:hypothetical protein